MIGSGTENWRDSDQPKPFRQDRYFYYMSGVDIPGCFLTYDIAKDFLTLYIPTIVPALVIWNGKGPTPEEAKLRYDVDDVRLTTRLEDDLIRWGADNPHSVVDL